MSDVLVAVELSFKLRTPREALRRDSWGSWLVGGGFWFWFGGGCEGGVLLSGELGKLCSALSHVLVSELVLGVELSPTTAEGVFTLELESELLLATPGKLCTGKCSLTFWYVVSPLCEL